MRDKFKSQRDLLKQMGSEKQALEGGPGSGRKPGGGVGRQSLYNADQYLVKMAKRNRTFIQRRINAGKATSADHAQIGRINKKIVKTIQFWSKSNALDTRIRAKRVAGVK